MRLHLSGGQMNDCTQVEPLLDAPKEEAILLADKGYDTEGIRAKAQAAGAFANIPARRNRIQSLPSAASLPLSQPGRAFL